MECHEMAIVYLLGTHYLCTQQNINKDKKV